MKKLILILFAVSIAFAVTAQSPFRPLPDNMFTERAKTMKAEGAYSAFKWRFDASLSIAELNYNKVTKQLVSSAFTAICPAIGVQHYVPTSPGDPTPFNNWGVSLALPVGTNIYEPDLAKFKVAVVANIMQYLKFGVTITPKPVEDFSAFGLFFGGGITF